MPWREPLGVKERQVSSLSIKDEVTKTPLSSTGTLLLRQNTWFSGLLVLLDNSSCLYKWIAGSLAEASVWFPAEEKEVIVIENRKNRSQPLNSSSGAMSAEVQNRQKAPAASHA